MRILDTIHKHEDIVEKIEIIESIEEEGIIKTKLKLKLFDATKLWIREVREADRLMAYSYYWLREDDSIIIGWDNAPHHAEVKTFPHHKHISEQIVESLETDIDKVLAYIKAFYG
jgi:hypothetical protein